MPMEAGRFAFVRFLCAWGRTIQLAMALANCIATARAWATNGKRQTNNATFDAFFFLSASRKTLLAFSFMRGCSHVPKMDRRNCFNWLDAVRNSQAAAKAITVCMTACPNTHRLATFWSVRPPFSYPPDAVTHIRALLENVCTHRVRATENNKATDASPNRHPRLTCPSCQAFGHRGATCSSPNVPRMNACVGGAAGGSLQYHHASHFFCFYNAWSDS